MRPLKSVAFTNTDEINDWLVKNFNYYQDYKDLLEKLTHSIKDDGFRRYAYAKYKEKNKLYCYYETLQKLMIQKNKDKELKKLIEDYNKYEYNEHNLICYEFNGWNNICKMLNCYANTQYVVYDDDDKPIGIKPYDSEIYSKNPFILPIEGFENLIEVTQFIKLKKLKEIYLGDSF